MPKDFRAPFVDPLTATGPAVLEIFSNPEKYIAQSLPVIGEIISPQEIVETFVKITGKKAVYSSTYNHQEMIDHFPELSSNNDLANEILDMAKYAVEYGYFSKDRDWEWSRKIDPNALTWEQFLLNISWKGEKISY